MNLYDFIYYDGDEVLVESLTSDLPFDDNSDHLIALLVAFFKETHGVEKVYGIVCYERTMTVPVSADLFVMACEQYKENNRIYGDGNW